MQALTTFQQPLVDYPAALFLPPAPAQKSHPRADYPPTFALAVMVVQPKRSPHPPHDFPCADCWKKH